MRRWTVTGGALVLGFVSISQLAHAQEASFLSEPVPEEANWSVAAHELWVTDVTPQQQAPASTDFFQFDIRYNVQLGSNPCDASNWQWSATRSFDSLARVWTVRLQRARVGHRSCGDEKKPVYGEVSTFVSGRWRSVDQILVKNVKYRDDIPLVRYDRVLENPEAFSVTGDPTAWELPGRVHVGVRGRIRLDDPPCAGNELFAHIAQRKRGRVLEFFPVVTGYFNYCLYPLSPQYKDVEGGFYGVLNPDDSILVRHAGAIGQTVSWWNLLRTYK